MGRYFGYGVITDVIVHNEDIVALLNWGGMLVADVGNSKLKLISRKKTSVIFELPAYASKSILYERYGAVATGKELFSELNFLSFYGFILNTINNFLFYFFYSA